MSCGEEANGTEDVALVSAERVMHSGLLHSITTEIDKLERVQEEKKVTRELEGLTYERRLKELNMDNLAKG